MFDFRNTGSQEYRGDFRITRIVEAPEILIP
jgi:hypothetical protein